MGKDKGEKNDTLINMSSFDDVVNSFAVLAFFTLVMAMLVYLLWR